MFLETSNSNSQHNPQAIFANAVAVTELPFQGDARKQHEPKPNPNPTRQLGVVLHDLCQPLTTLQCRLELAELVDTEAGYREAVTLGLAECARLTDCVTQMRELLRRLSLDPTRPL